jgi:D-alanyl-lipoteichoic acid acyltransferase DltB (MBOAT superfamily)
MSFNSTLYILFLPAVLLLYYRLQPAKRMYMLLVASWLFYAVYNPWFMWVILATTGVDFVAGRMIEATEDPARRKLWVALSVTSNLGLLCFFKYTKFLATNFVALAGLFHWKLPEMTAHIALPLGISFHTFQGISYTVDVYRKHIKPLRSFAEFALFVSFFPQLVAGPIVRAPEFIPQIDCRSEADDHDMKRGLGMILYGMVKKVYVADVMAGFVNDAYADPARFSGLGLMFATYAFTVQIYCDFSGYSDMAIGSALLFGIKLPRNFDRPYLATTIREFWQRWHMTLSRWLRDYLYIPLGGNRRGNTRTYVNLMVTMLLGGLWHGAGWNWIVWGGIQGAVMSIERATGFDAAPRSVLGRAVRWLVTLHVAWLSWIFFRARTLGEALQVLGRIVRWAPGSMGPDTRVVLYAGTALGFVLLADYLDLKGRLLSLFDDRPAVVRWTAYAAVALFVLTFSRASHPEFIYFAF